MTIEKITDSDLHKLLSIYDVYKQERVEDEIPFLSLLALIEQGTRDRAKGDFQNPTILGFRSTGQTIGEMALLENLPRSATVIALDIVSLWRFSREAFYQFVRENPSFSINLMYMLSGRIRKSEEERMRGYAREKKQVVALETLSRQATHDPLTGLFNRRYLDQILYGEIAHAMQSGSMVGILMVDVDHFKQVNDRYGHRAGDLMLQSLGRLMKDAVRSADIVCRYGGEEFVIVMPGVSEAAVDGCAEDIRFRFEESRVIFENQEIHATISLGAAIYPLHGSSVDEVFVNADRAMYEAKNHGRNRVAVFSPREFDANLPGKAQGDILSASPSS
jgi:diguanylate cyclase (GGDEF)-like protein